MSEDDLPEWKKMEKKVCKKENMEHIGGSGKPDCIDLKDLDNIVEVKTYNRSFNSHDLKTLTEKDWVKGKKLTINVINSCTKHAIELAEKNPNVTLKCNVKKELEEIGLE